MYFCFLIIKLCIFYSLDITVFHKFFVVFIINYIKNKKGLYYHYYCYFKQDILLLFIFIRYYYTKDTVSFQPFWCRRGISLILLVWLQQLWLETLRPSSQIKLFILFQNLQYIVPFSLALQSPSKANILRRRHRCSSTRTTVDLCQHQNRVLFFPPRWPENSGVAQTWRPSQEKQKYGLRYWAFKYSTAHIYQKVWSNAFYGPFDKGTLLSCMCACRKSCGHHFLASFFFFSSICI